MTVRWPKAPAPVVAPALLPAQPARDRIKVLHVITRLAGGSGGNTLVSARGMDADDYEMWIAGAPGGGMWDDAERAGVRTVRLGRMRESIAPADDAATVVELVTLMRRERFSIVHTHCAKAGLLGRLAARLAGVPVVVHTFHALAVHDFMSPRRRAAYLAMDRAARPLAHHYVAVAPRLARQAVALRLATPGATSVVPSGVDLAAVPTTAAPGVREELGIPADAKVVGTVGRIVKQKAPIDFVRMAALVQQSVPGTRFVMVGEAEQGSGPLEEEARAEARRLGVDVVFTGHRADAVEIAAAFDVYVVPSLYEGLGRALTEAMASGRPVVATNVNGVPDLVEPGSTGLLASPGDPESLAVSVTWCLTHPEEAAAMGAQGRARAMSMFDSDTMCEALDIVYARLLGIDSTRHDADAAATASDVVHQIPGRVVALPRETAGVASGWYDSRSS